MSLTNNKEHISEYTVGNTEFTVISVQSEFAKESAYTKVKKLILNNANLGIESIPNTSKAV